MGTRILRTTLLYKKKSNSFNEGFRISRSGIFMKEKKKIEKNKSSKLGSI